ncbi:Penicillin-binding protein, transpeptidase [Candidatus Sulfopaludibacter sp. SbA4]|nr:Penicillin-binding protein, transpeptidase [Candidatus Sulfopaludibacter sp. SbA4]
MIAVLVALGNSIRAGARSQASLDRLVEPAQGIALLVDVRTRKSLGVHGAAAAAAQLVPPGSTLKPFVLAALLRAAKIGPQESYPCPGRLRIAGRSFDCSHPRLAAALQVSSALAYSCNCFAAHFAERFERGELAAALERAGLGSLTGLVGAAEVTGRIPVAAGTEANQLQALGEEPLLVTAAEMAMGYRTLALSAGHPEMAPVVEGLEGAVEYGTAQLAHVDGVRVAGKTGSVRTASGARMAWFAGFAPSRAPEVVVTVMLQGRSGGADAAPIAGRILQAWRAGKIA